MADDPPSEWTRAGVGLYGLTDDELRLVILCVRESYEASGRWLTATELRMLLRRPGR